MIGVAAWSVRPRGYALGALGHCVVALMALPVASVRLAPVWRSRGGVAPVWRLASVAAVWRLWGGV